VRSQARHWRRIQARITVDVTTENSQNGGFVGIRRTATSAGSVNTSRAGALAPHHSKWMRLPVRPANPDHTELQVHWILAEDMVTGSTFPPPAELENRVTGSLAPAKDRVTGSKFCKVLDDSGGEE
jgi:hypothetical protein